MTTPWWGGARAPSPRNLNHFQILWAEVVEVVWARNRPVSHFPGAVDAVMTRAK